MSRIIFGVRQSFSMVAKLHNGPRMLPASLMGLNHYIDVGVNVHIPLTPSPAGQIRNLYSESALGMEKLDALQEKKSMLFSGPAKDRYLERLKGFLDSGDIKSVFKDDLINLLGIADSDEHLALLEDLIAKTKDDPDAIMSGWGTTLMRLYYKMGKIERALENIKNFDRFGTFFNQRACYRIVMTMLYNAGRYREVVDMFYLADQKLVQSREGGERLLAPIAFASLAKMNKPEDYQEAKELHQKLSQFPPERGASRSAQFLASMAIAHGEPKYALNLISSIPTKNYVCIRELKIASLMRLERYEDILFQLREYIESIRRDTAIMLMSTYEMVENSIDKITDPSVRQELSDTLLEIKNGGHVSESSIDELLFKEMKNIMRPPLDVRYQTSGLYNSRGNYNQSRPPRYDDGRQQYNSNYNDDNRGSRRRSYNDNRGNDRMYEDEAEDRSDRRPGGSHGRDRRFKGPNRGFTYQNVDLSN